MYIGTVSSRSWTSFPWMMTLSGLAVVGTNETGMVKGVIGSSETWKVSVQSGLLRKMMLENFGEVGQDGIVAPCVAFLVESCRTAVENMVNCTRSSVAEGAARV